MFPDIKPPLTHVERLLVDFSKLEKPTVADFMVFRTRLSVGDYLDRYRARANKMTDEELQNEGHSSRRLKAFMRRSGDPAPSPRCDCHHMISGGHRDALLMRLVMAAMAMRVDDPHNGCWLPRDWEDRSYMPNYLRSGVPHRRIHTDNYYRWLSGRINMAAVKTPEQLIQALRFARHCLQSGAVPPNVMPQTGR
ncbi:AHH domain-containing protein [uncultured Microbulbifer sp.]|uniref:AHH domain-containing protein n=1 Tax=uncultured Microbulbifer sp. TaxID=348147 RepID=UPI002639B7E0|nr:AHH domain-containing protein [uncultured Microbulbifer sp.]